MSLAAFDHITDIDALRAAMRAEIAKRDAEIGQRDAVIATYETVLGKRDREIRLQSTRIEQLTQVIAKLQRLHFAARSEKFDPNQQALFDAAFGSDIGAIQAELDVLRPVPRERAQPKRQPLPPELPRVEERIEPTSCFCGACGGELHCIGEEVSEKLDVKPIEFFVRRIIRPKLACRGCETMHTPPTLPAIIERGIAAPGLLAHILISKYADHLPLNRQSEMLARSGVTLPVSTLSEWVGATGFALQPLVDALRSELHRCSVLHADETPVQLLAPGKGKTQTAYLFAYRRGEIAEPPIIVFDFAENRSGSHARRFLADYGGALVVDDYAGYKSLFQSTPMREIGCWAHARRKFFELHDANKSVLAAEALTRIGAIYVAEREADGMNADARHAHREQHARPRVDALFAWLESLRPNINSGSATAKAVDYLLRRKAAFTAYLDDGRFPIDNNPVENAIRPIALGRKNWLFAGSALAGQRAANIMSLIQTAKANGHDPHAYLRDVLTRLPTQLNSRISELLPHTWQPTSP
jgi:transposase